MGLKSDKWIRQMSLEHDMIQPFCEKQVGKNIVSFGLSSYGYDIRVGSKFMIFSNVDSMVVDPKNFHENNVITKEAKDGFCIVPPNSFALAHTVEYFKMPRDTLAICLGKSTYARCGIIVNVTPFEPEFEGISLLRLATLRHCLPKSTQMRVSLKCCFFKVMKCVK